MAMRGDLNSKIEALVSRRRGSGGARPSAERAEREQFNRITSRINALVRDTVVPSLDRCAKFLVPAGMQVEVTYERWNPATDDGARASLRIVSMDNQAIVGAKPELQFRQTPGRERVAVRIEFPDAIIPGGRKSNARVNPDDLTTQFVENAAREFLETAIE